MSPKIHIDIAFISHVNSGKSTTSGHLINKLERICEKTMNKLETESINLGYAGSKYAWFMDRLKAERERGLAIDIHLWKIETAKYPQSLTHQDIETSSKI